MTIVDVLTTGGTISLRSSSTGVADRDAGYAPGDLAASLGLPDIELRFRAVLDKGSKDIEPADWQVLARAVASSAGESDGVVVLHGTDTMHYTASALSFMVQRLPVPVVLTGSMVPGGDPGSDAPANLRDAVLVAATADLAEVCLVFAGKVLRGNRSRKVHSTAVDAFTGVDFPPLGTVEDGKVLLGGAQLRRQPGNKVELSADLDPEVVLVKLTPAVNAARLRRLLDGASGAVLEGTGVGHLKDELHAVVAEFGKPTVITTQVERGGERLGSYASDQLTLALPNVLRGGDMTSEAALLKLMWALPRNADVRQSILADVAGERTAADLMDDI